MPNWYIRNKPKQSVDYSLPIVLVREKIVLLLLAPTYIEPNYQWLNLNDGHINSGTGWRTPEEALEAYHDGHLAFNVNIANLIRHSDIKYTTSM